MSEKEVKDWQAAAIIAITTLTLTLLTTGILLLIAAS